MRALRGTAGVIYGYSTDRGCDPKAGPEHEPGKLVDGNPLDGYWNMLNTKVLLKGGGIVVDKR